MKLRANLDPTMSFPPRSVILSAVLSREYCRARWSRAKEAKGSSESWYSFL
jgi:hypothetical protein